jgi:hypothetical protein
VLQASAAADPRIAAVSVFLYPTEGPTTYTGAVMVGFMAANDRPWYEMNLRDGGRSRGKAGGSDGDRPCRDRTRHL